MQPGDRIAEVARYLAESHIGSLLVQSCIVVINSLQPGQKAHAWIVVGSIAADSVGHQLLIASANGIADRMFCCLFVWQQAPQSPQLRNKLLHFDVKCIKLTENFGV
jgi:hypothetical protein